MREKEFKAAAAITPGDGLINLPGDVPHPQGCMVYVGGTGTLVVETAGLNDVTFMAVPAGTILPVRVRRVYATSTATHLVALW